MLSIGHRTGLFQVMSKLPPATSGEHREGRRAARALCARVAGQHGCEPDRRLRPQSHEHYALPAEHAMSLTPDAGPNNMAAYADAIPVFAGVVGPVAECFRKGGGVPYSAVPNVQEVIAGLTNPLYDAYLVDSILPLVGLDERLNARRGGRGHRLRAGSCRQPHGQGVSRRARFIGFDFSDEGVAAARSEAESWG